MSRVKRPRLSTEPDRVSTAAYAASQPLFSTLRNATDSIDTQKASLTTARDVVQQLHVKIDTGDAERHETYMQNVVGAWEAATEAYCKVFEELCNVTRADDSEGRPQGKRHEEFARILETVRQARDAVKDCAPAKAEEEEAATAEKDDFSDGIHVETTTNIKPAAQTNDKKRKLADAEPLPDAFPHQRADQSDDDEIVVKHNSIRKKAARPAQAAKPSKTKTPPQKSLLDDTIRYSRLDPTKIIWENGQLKVPFERLSPDERKAWSVIKQRQKRQIQRTKVKANRAKGPPAAKDDAEAKQKVEPDEYTAPTQDDKPESSVPTPTPANGQDEGVPAVEYEDVSAEVEARLKAKAEKTAQEKAKKPEKKRKRESKDSFVNPGVEQEDPVAAPEAEADSKDKPVKPAKKKSKKAADSGVSVNGTPVDANAEGSKAKKAPRKIQKRKNGGEDEEDGDEIKVAEAPAKSTAKKRTRHF